MDSWDGFSTAKMRHNIFDASPKNYSFIGHIIAAGIVY